MVNLTKHTQVFNLKKTPTNNYQVQLQKKNTNSQNLSLKNILGNLASQFTPLDVVPALPGLVPVTGTPFYANPNSPAAPDDCDLYPDSPFCGGNPFTFTPVGIEPAIVLDPCHLGIQLTPVLGFIKLPPVQVVYQSNAPECQVNKPTPPEYTPTQGFCLDFTCSNRQNKGQITVHFSGTASPFALDTFDAFEHPGWQGDDEELDAPISKADRLAAYLPYAGKEFPYFGPSDIVPYPDDYPDREFLLSEGLHFKYFELSTNLGEYDYKVICLKPTPIGASAYRKDYSLQTPGANRWHIEFYDSPTEPDRTRADGNSAHTLPFVWFDDFTVSFSCSLVTFNPPPPPLPMQCCPPAFNPAILQLILINQNKIMTAIGVEELPATLPKRLIYPNAKGEEKIENIVQALGYQVKQIDKAVGYLPQKIKVLDTNSAQAGNQSVEVEIHSFADFAKETLQYLIDTEGDEDTLANIAVRILYECGAIHQLSVQIAAMVDAAIEHLDFKEGWKTVEVPFSYDPYAGQKGKKAGEGFGTTPGKPLPLTEEELEKLMPDLLKETLVKIKVLINTQKRTLNDLMQELLRDTRIAAAGVSENASSKRLVEIVEAAQAALQLQNTIARNNVRKALTSGDLRTRKKPK